MATFNHLSGGAQYAATLTASSSTHTKGTYTELASSTAFNSGRQRVGAHFQPAQLHMWDLATGAAASETVRLGNMISQTVKSSSASGGFWKSHIDIPSGTRIAARTQSNTSSGTIDVWVLLEDLQLSGATEPVTYGSDTSTTRGVSVDPGASADTKGSYSQITASTSSDHKAFGILVGKQGDTTVTLCYWNVDIATGAAASEVVILPDLPYRGEDQADIMLPPTRMFITGLVASGTRLAVRAACSINTATRRLFDVILIGMDDLEFGSEFSSTGSGAASFTGKSTASAVWSSAGTGTAAFVGQNATGTVDGVWSAAGSGAAAWTGFAVKPIARIVNHLKQQEIM